MMSAEPKPRLIHAAIGGLLARYVRFVGVVVASDRGDDGAVRASTRTTIPASSPCGMASSCCCRWRGRQDIAVDIMLARHGDAELMGAVLREFGMRLIRGAGAGGRRKDRGGVHAFRAAVQALREGRSVGMTADVPGGEARRAGLGVVMIARASGRPIMPLAIATSRYLALNSWSRMTINLPWSNLGFAVGEVVHVPRDAHDEQLEAYRQAVERSLNAATALAYARAGADPGRATPGYVAPPGLRLKAYRALTALARPLAPLILRLRQRRGKEDAARLPERMGRPSAPRPAGRLVWLHAASVGETLSILPLIVALAERARRCRSCSPPAPSPRQRSPPSGCRRARCISIAPLDVPAVRAQLPRPLAAGSRRPRPSRRSGPT